MDALTDRQLEVLRFIARQIEDNGYPPTIREIGEALDIRSTNGVNDHLKALERKGFLTRDPVKSRALIPTPQAREALGGGARHSNVVPFARTLAPAPKPSAAARRDPDHRARRRRPADPGAGARRGHGAGGLVPARHEQEGVRAARAGRLDDWRRDPPRRLHLREEAAPRRGRRDRRRDDRRRGDGEAGLLRGRSRPLPALEPAHGAHLRPRLRLPHAR